MKSPAYCVTLRGARDSLEAWLEEARQRLEGAGEEANQLARAIAQTRWSPQAAHVVIDHPRAGFLSDRLAEAAQRAEQAVECGPVPTVAGLTLAGTYALPGGARDRHVIPVSGGADSTVMAILMRELFPRTEFTYLFTDTEAEDPEIYENLARLERYLGEPIVQVHPTRGLYPLIEHWGGFLPGPQSRYCTRALKLEPFEAAMESIRPPNGVVHSYVGLRADEAGARTGLVSTRDWILTHTPFIELGVGRQEVFSLLDKTVGVPRMYQYRSRSGCVVCPFQRRAELVQSAKRYPQEWRRGAEAEKLAEQDRDRYAPRAPGIREEVGRPHNATLPIPGRVDSRTAATARPTEWVPSHRTPSATGDLFGRSVELFVGAEFFIHPGVGDHGVWHQALVTYSTSRAGLAKALNHHYQMRLQAPEAWGLDQAEMADELQYAIYRVLLPPEVADVSAPSKESYTWHAGEAYVQIEQIVAAVSRCLEAAGLRQEMSEYEAAPPGSWEAEQYEALRATYEKLEANVGEVVAMDLFEPDTTEPAPEEKHVACFHCSI